jgi:hypothetical protein
MYTQKIAVHRLSSQERHLLSLQMYPLQAQLFTGVDFDAFRQYVVDSTAWRTWIYLHYSQQGDLVGYLAMHTFRRVIEGQRRQIFRMETGKLPAFRGQDLTILRALGRMLLQSISGLRYESYFFASMVYPASYAMAAKYAPRIWPTFQQPTPTEKQLLMFELAANFKLLTTDPTKPYVRHVGWITREHGRQPAWNSAVNPHAVYFVEENPTFTQGHGLLTLMPASLADICRAVGRLLVGRGRRLLRRY